MEQSKKTNSLLGVPKNVFPRSRFSTGAKCYARRYFINDLSNNLIASVEEAVKKFNSSDTVHINKGYDSSHIIEISKEILDLGTLHSMQFSNFLCQFEKWSAQRRMLIKKVESIQKSLNRTKSTCVKGQMVFSVIDVTVTLTSLFLENLNDSFAPKLLIVSAAFGFLGLACRSVEISQTKSCIEKVLKELWKEKVSLQNLHTAFNQMMFDINVMCLFPHGISAEIAQLLQKSNGNPPKSIMGRNDLKGLNNLIKAFPTFKLSKKIWISIIITNALQDTSMLKDEDFLSKAEVFSKSSVAEIWWKRRMQTQDFPDITNSVLEAKLKSCLKLDSMPLHPAPPLYTAIWVAPTSHLQIDNFQLVMHTIGSIFVNSLLVCDYYYGFRGVQDTKEIDILKQLKNALQKGYDDVMSLYEKLSPHNDL